MTTEEAEIATRAMRGKQPGDGISFSSALIMVKDGHRAARAGWNGKDMWICLGDGRLIPASQFWNKHTKAFAESQPEQKAHVLPYLLMKTADNKIQMGWLASQTDMLAEDWIILAD